MNLKPLTLATMIAVITAGLNLYAQTPAEKIDEKVDQKVEQVEQKAKEIEATLEKEMATATPPEDALIDQYKSIKDKNYKALELDLAKDLALHRNSAGLAEQEAQLYEVALQGLTATLGQISEPQKEENYFDYQENAETGEFSIALVKDSYIKSERGDICQIGIQVHLKTSVLSEFSEKPEKTTTSVTQIECYNNAGPTYSQRLVN